MRGIVGGRTRPFIDGRAIFTVMDRSLRCETACGTGWSGCGNPPEALRGGVATVQVAGADGRPIAASLAGIGGLAPGADVIVRGTVAAGSTTQALIVNAAAIHVAAAR